jgi:hypothetical protein
MDDKKFQSLTKPQQDLVIKISTEAERQGVRPELALAVAEAETGGAFSHYRGDKVLTSPAGAKGVMQIMPDTANLYNKKYNLEIDPDNEDSNIKGGVAILKDLLTTYKSPRNAVALYNASPKAVSQFMKLYETDPDKAILSLPNETRNYSLRISKNFNLDDDKETGLISVGGDADAPKSTSPFEGYESESSKFKREQEEAAKNAPPPSNPEDKQGGISAPEVGAIAGAGVNALLPIPTNPTVSPRVDTGRAQEANLTAQDRLELARRNLDAAAPQGTAELEDTFRQSQGELERLKNEQRLADARLKGLPKAPPVIEPPAPSSPFPQVDLTKVGRASGPKVEGDSGTRNWMIQEAGQKHQLPEAILDMATNKTKESPTGGARLINEDLANLEKIKQLGAGDFGLTTTQGGVQLQLPPTTVAERQADIDRQNQQSQNELTQRTEQTRLQQESQARQLEQQRLAHEADLERLRQERAQLGQQHNALTSQVKGVAPLQRAVTKAETDAEIAQRKLARAQQQPNAAGRVLEQTGVGSTKIGALPRAIVGAGTGYLGVMSYQEAMARFKAGDTSEGVLKALEAGAAGMSMLPPAGKAMTKVRGAGVLGGLGLGTYELGRRLLKDRPPEE